MAHYHPITGEELHCNHCIEQRPIKYFVCGLYPICKECSEEYLQSEGETVFDKFHNMKENRRII